MLELKIQGEFFDEKSNHFIKVGPKIVRFEHSLHTLSIWESKWRKPFLSNEDKSTEETIDYVRIMAIDEISELELLTIMNNYFDQISDYIQSSQTATTIKHRNAPIPNRQIITSELIYYWMFTAGIPAEPCEHWHLSRLLTLIEVFGIQNSPKKKMSRSELAQRYRDLNAQRRAKYGSKG